MKYNITDFETIRLFIFSYTKYDYIIHKYQKINNDIYIDDTSYQCNVFNLEDLIRCLSKVHEVICEVTNDTLSIYFQ